MKVIFIVNFEVENLKDSLDIENAFQILNQFQKDMKIEPYLSDGTHPIKSYRFELDSKLEENILVLIDALKEINLFKSYEIGQRLVQNESPQESSEGTCRNCSCGRNLPQSECGNAENESSKSNSPS